MKPQVKFVITDVPMWLSHAGLNEVIRVHKKKNDIFKAGIKDGGLILFLNAPRTAAKLFSENGEVIGYLRLPNGGKLTERSIDFIPKTFGGSVEYSSAVKRDFKKFLEEEKKQKPGFADRTVLHA